MSRPRRKAIPPRVRFACLRDHNFACFYCGLPAGVVVLQIDHVVPVVAGGTNDPWNLVPACPECNAGKLDIGPTREMVDAARAVFMATRQDRFVQCSVCGVPTIPDPDDEITPTYYDTYQCVPCNEAVYAAYLAGMAHGKSMR